MNVNEPTTMLQAALDALGDCYNSAGKTVHLSPGQAAALLVEDERKDWLEVENKRLHGMAIDLANRLSEFENAEPPNPYEPTEVWDNETGAAYDTQPNVIQQALDSLSPEMRASHFTTLRKIQDEQEAARDERKRQQVGR